MPGYSQTALANQARNTNSVTVMIGDTVVAFAQTTAHAFGFGTEHLHGIGSALPQEIQQLKITPNISIDAFALTATGINLLAGGNNIATLLGNNQFDLHIVDGVTEKTLFTYVGCVASNFSQNLAANQPITESLAFLALDVLDENGNSVLNTNSAFSVPSALAAGGAVAGALGLTP
jgi:hypothetical protein